MSLEIEIQKYPKEIKLKDGSKCKLRPLRKDDEKHFHAFFVGVPEPERMFIKHRVIDPEVIRDWCQNIDLGRNLPLLAFMDGKIVGDATLHQQLGGWKRHIGRVSVLVHPKYRGRGLARALVSEIVSIVPRSRQTRIGPIYKPSKMRTERKWITHNCTRFLALRLPTHHATVRQRASAAI